MSFESITTYPWDGGRIFFISSFEFIIISFMCGGELSSSYGLLVMQLVNIRESNFLLQTNINVSYSMSLVSKSFLGQFHSKSDSFIFFVT
jgi:hypothetical protein